MSQFKQFLQVKINELNSACKRWWRALRRTMESFGWPSSVYCPQGLIDLFPPYFIKLCQNIHPKTPLKCDISIWAGPNTFTFWSASFQIKLAPLILYTTLVYTSTDISNFRYSNQKMITLVWIFGPGELNR